jgi:O-antigen ligase
MSFKISRFFLYAAVFAVTLVTTSTLFPFIVGKYAWFRSAVDFAFVFFLIGLLRERDGDIYFERFRKVLRSPLGVAVSAFTAMFLLACVFGVDPANSFWSNFERGEGGVQIIHLYGFFLLLATLFNEEKDWLKIFWCSFAAAFISIIYGLMAGLGAEGAIGPAFGNPDFRFQGSIGNPAYFATYMVFMLFFALYLLFTKYRGQLKSWRPVPVLAAIAVFAIFLFLAATRGAFLALIASGVVFLGFMAFSRKEWRKRLIALAIFAIVAVSGMVFLKDNPTVKKLPFARVFDISFTTKTFSDRRIIWKMAWDGFKERPLLGAGPENFLYVFDHNFNTAYFEPPAAFGAWFDRAHNIVFDYLAEIGLLGTLAYLSIFAIFYVEFWKNGLKKHAERGSASRMSLLPSAARAIIFALPVAYLVQGMVLFDILPTYLNVFLFFGLAYYLLTPSPAKTQNTQ